jgi:hypothetical protein
MVLGLGLSFRPAGCVAPAAGGNVVIPDTEGLPDLPDETPIEEDPDWTIPPDPTPEPDPLPPPLVIRGQEIAQTRLEENGVAYRNQHAGPKDKKTKAGLVEIEQEQGYIAPLVVDSDNFAGTTYDPADGKLKAHAKVAGVQTTLAEVTITVESGDEIGGMVKGGKYWITLNDQAVTAGVNIPPALEEAAAGLIAKGPATDAWIDSFSSNTMKKGYGGSYGFGYGNAV